MTNKDKKKKNKLKKKWFGTIYIGSTVATSMSASTRTSVSRDYYET